jgi:hypothetical protein
MDIRCGNTSGPGIFASIAEKEEAYLAYKRRYGPWKECWRPAGFWQFEFKSDPRLELAPGVRERNAAALVRLGVATDEEIGLFRKWHDQEYSGHDLELKFRWHPQFKIHYEHEKKIIRQLEAKNSK